MTISRNPKLFLSKGLKLAFAKFQPSKSLIFDKLQTIQETQKQKYVSDRKPNPNDDSTSTSFSSTEESDF